MLFDILQVSLRLCLYGIENFKDGYLGVPLPACTCLGFFSSRLNRGRMFLRRLTEVESQSYRIHSARLSKCRLHLDHSQHPWGFPAALLFFSHCTPWRRGSQLSSHFGKTRVSAFLTQNIYMDYLYFFEGNWPPPLVYLVIIRIGEYPQTCLAQCCQTQCSFIRPSVTPHGELFQLALAGPWLPSHFLSCVS